MTGRVLRLCFIIILVFSLGSCTTVITPYRIDSSRVKDHPFNPLGLSVSHLQIPQGYDVGLLARELDSIGITVLIIDSQDQRLLLELIGELSYNVAYIRDGLWVASLYPIGEVNDTGALLQTGDQTLFVGIESQESRKRQLVTIYGQGLLDPLARLSRESEEPHEIFSSGLLPLSYERKVLEATGLELGYYLFAIP